MGGSGIFWLLVWVAPALAGATVAYAKPPEAVAWINRASGWWSRRYLAARAKGGMIVGGVWRWLIWGFHKLDGATARIEDDAARAGVRVALFFYVGGLSLFIVASAIYVVLVFALIVLGFWILGKVMNANQPSGGPRETAMRQAPDKREERRHGIPVYGPRVEQCECRHGCQTSALITRYSCGCCHVELRNDQLARDDCTNFTGRRYHCGAAGVAG